MRRELDEAADLFERTRDRWAESELLPVWACITYVARGEGERARQVLAQCELKPFAATLSWLIDVHADRKPGSAERAVAALRAQFARGGRITLNVLASATEFDRDAALEIAMNAELGLPADAPNPTGGLTANLAIIFTRALPEVRRDPRFIAICARLGLVDYWLATDKWPDCVDEVAPYYDFKAECRRAADARRSG